MNSGRAAETPTDARFTFQSSVGLVPKAFITAEFGTVLIGNGFPCILSRAEEKKVVLQSRRWHMMNQTHVIQGTVRVRRNTSDAEPAVYTPPGSH